MAFAPSNRSAFGRAVKLCVKELREILRDRRTIITLVLMPILVYPLLAVIFQRLMVTMATSVDGPTVVLVGVESQYDAEQLDDLLRQADAFRPEESQPPPAAEIERPPGTPSLLASAAAKQGEVQFKYFSPDDLSQALANREVEVVVRSLPYRSVVSEANAHVHATASNVGAPMATLLSEAASFPIVEDNLNAVSFPRSRPSRVYFVEYDPGSALARAGLKKLEDDFELLNERSYQMRLMQMQQRSGRAMVLERQPTVEAGATTAGALATLVPLILILMTIAGGVYPAIDLTAGERERGTLEMLVAAPVPRIAILAGKYVAVVTVAVLTALVNLLGMAVTLAATGMSSLVLGDGGLNPLILLQVFGLLVLFASFFSAVLLAITSFARSFKEAQAYLIPLMLFSLAPGLLALTPGLRLSLPLAVTPLVNMVLLARDAMAQNVEPAPAMIAVAATILYAAAAVSVAAAIFGADAVLYGGTGGWSEMLKRPETSSPVASPANALLCLAVLFPAFFLISSSLGQFQEAPMILRMSLGAVATFVLFVWLPLLAVHFGRVRFASGLQLWLPRFAVLSKKPNAEEPPGDASPAMQPFGFLATGGMFVAALVLGVSLWPLAHELVLLSLRVTPSLIDDSKFQLVLEMLEEWGRLPLPAILLCMAVTPAVCEEFFFRGYLFAAFRPKMNGWQTVLATSVLFGLFHVVTSAALAPERFLPSTFLGLILGVIAWRTRSIWPGVVLHVVHNGLLLSMAYYREELAAAGWGLEAAATSHWGAGEPSHLPITWLATSGLTVALAGGVLWFCTQQAEPSSESGDTQR